MGFLDQTLGDLSLDELQRLIRDQVALQIPPIPAGVAGLSDLDVPLVPPDSATNGDTLTYHAPSNRYIAAPITAASVGTDNATPDAPVQGTPKTGPGWIQANWAKPAGTADALVYKIFIRDGSTPTITDDTYLVGTTAALSLVISTLADGTTTLVEADTYHIVVVAISTLSGNPSGGSSETTASPGGVDASEITVSNIDAALITTGSLDAARISATSITADKLNVTSLSAIAADLGTITAGTITGATIQTATSGQRVVIDLDGAHLFAADGSTIVDLPTDSDLPAAFTGSLTAQSLISQAATFNGTTQVIGEFDVSGGVAKSLTPPALFSVPIGGALAWNTRYWIAFSWYDGTHETQPSPVANIRTPASGIGGNLPYIVLTLPPAPAGVTEARIYVDSSTFSPGAGHLQDTITVSTTDPTGYAFDTYDSGGAASSATNTFPATGFGKVQQVNVVDSNGDPYGWVMTGSGRIRFVGPTMRAQYWWYSDFLGGANLPSELNNASSGGTLSNGTPTTTNIGVLEMDTGSTASGRAGVGTAAQITPGASRIRFTAYFTVVSGVPNGTNNYQIALGLVHSNDDSAVTTNDAIAFTLSSASSTLLGLRTTSGGATHFQQALDAAGTNVNIAAGSYHLVDFELNAAATSIDWWVDGVKQTPVTVNIPTSSMWMHAGITKTAGTATRGLALDAMSLFGDFVS